MPSSAIPVEPAAPEEAPHEAYLRWATEFGLIEWVVDEDGEVYYTTPDCGHECQHDDESFQPPVLVPAYTISKRRMSTRVVVTAGMATLATLGVHQMADASQQEMRFEAASGETVVLQGDDVRVIPATIKKHTASQSTEAAVVGPVVGTPIWPYLARQIDAQRAEENRVTMKVRSAVEYRDHRSSNKDTTPLKTSKRVSTNKDVPPVTPKVDIPVVIPVAKKAGPPTITLPPVAAAPAQENTAPPAPVVEAAPPADPAPAPVAV